jgi:hypothetical protein
MKKKIRALVLIGAVVVLSILASAPGASGAPVPTWHQTDWSGGADTVHFPIYPTHQTGWTRFFSRDAGIAIGPQLTLAPIITAITQTTDAHFRAGTFSITTVLGTGIAAEIILMRGLPVWTHVSANWLPVGVGHYAAPAFADLDSDGDFDLAVGDNTGAVEYFRNDGTRFIPSWTHVSPGVVGVSLVADPAFADIDNDGDFDLAVGNRWGFIEYFENTGTAASPIWTHRSSNWLGVDVGDYAAPAFADIDGDGDFDLAVGGHDGFIEYFRNDGTRFSPIWIHVTATWLSVRAGQAVTPAFADIDGDGDFDLAVGNMLGHVEYFENTGTAASPAWTLRSSNWLPVWVGSGRTDPAFADIDNDGDFDLAVGDHGGLVEHFRNDAPSRTPGTFISSAIDTGQASDFTTLGFTISRPVGTDLNFQLRSATTSAELAAAPWRGPDGTGATRYTTSGTTIHPAHDGHRWIQYKAFFSTADTTITSRLSDITINFQFFPTTSPSLISSPFDTMNPNNVLTRISWARTLPAGTATRFQVRTAPASAGPWTPWAGPCDGVAGTFATTTFFTDHTGGQLIDADMRNAVHDQWIQYRVWLDTTDTVNTPVLLDVTMDTDRTPPTVTITTTAPNPTNVSPIPMTATFSEPVIGFVAGDITVTNGVVTPASFAGGPTAFTFNVTPAAPGVVTVGIAASGATDAAGNSNTAAVPLSRTFDNVAPTVTITTTAPDPTNVSPIPMTATFSEAVTGFVAGDITVTNGNVTAGSFAGGPTVFTFTVTPAAQGVVTVGIPASGATDAAGNSNTAAPPLSRTFDTVAPTVTITSTAPDPTNVSPIPMTATFSEAVTGFVAGDITVTNGNVTAASFAGGPTVFTFTVTPAAQGVVTVSIAASGATDAAGNSNTAAPPLSRTFDTVAPTVTITTTAPDPTNVSPIPMTATFSEPVTGFVAGDITVTNGVVTPASFAGTGAVYTFNVTPAAQGVVTVGIAATVATDAAGNSNTASPTFSITFDSVAPTVTITSTAPDPTNVSPIPMTATFSEAVTGFVLTDITVTNGAAANLTTTNNITFTFNVTPAAQGVVTVGILAGVATDAATNPNTAAPPLSRTFDTVAPTVTITSTAPDPTNVSPIPMIATFSEPVTGFVLTDITVTNGAAANLTTTNNITFTFTVTPAAQGVVTVGIPASGATDAAGNSNTAAVPLSRTFDTVAPTVTITTTAPDPTNVSPIPMTATFSEPVTGFVAGDITVTNGVVTPGSFAGTGAVYTFNVTPAAQGVVTVGIHATVATDAAGNSNTASPTFSITFDSVAPTVTITSTAPNPTNVSPIPMTATFSEAVTGFVAADITVTNGNVTAASFAGGPTVFTFNVTPAAQGVVTVGIAATVATDAAGNSNTASPTFSITFDSVAPTVTITSTAPNPTNVSPIPMTATFSEAVTGFVAADITVTNGNVTAASFAGGPTVFTFTVTPAAQGVVTVNITATVATDAAGNSNTAAVPLSRTFDNVAPTVTITTTAPNPTNVSPIPMTATFSEPVTDFVAGDITVTNGVVTPASFAGTGAVYTFNVTPAAQGVVTVGIAATVATDAAGNSNTAAVPLSRTFDTVAPTVIITSTAPDPTNVSPIPMTATFSEAVTGFILADITVTNGAAANLTTANNITFTFNVTPAAQGVVTVGILAGVATDAATNPNTAAPPLSRTFDTVAPTVTITSTAPDPTNVSPIPMIATFSEPVTGFVLTDITVTNGAAANLTTTNNITFTFTVTPAAQGVVTVGIPASGATDAAGNSNTAAVPLSRTFDTVAPTVTITTTAPDPTNVSPIPMTATFSEPVTGFVAGDITVTNGVVTPGSFAGTGAVYTFNVTPAAQGVVTVGIAATVATDAAGNSNTAAVPLSRTFDTVAPTVTITSTAPDPTNVSPIPMTATFSEAVTGFILTDITVTNGAAANLTTANNITFTFNVTPAAQGVVTVGIGAGVAHDAAGNSNTASPTFSITFDSVAPTVTITSTAPDPTNVSPIPMTATFSEPVTGFVAGDITVTNGAVTAGSFAGGPTVFTFTVTPAAQGVVTVGIPASGATDAAGNSNTAAVPLSRTFDTVAPTVTITSTAPDPTNVSPIPMTATFSEPVTGFVAGDITVTNGVVTTGSFTGTGAVYNWTVTPAAQGVVTASIAATVATDAAGNSNTASSTASSTFSITFDSVAPTVTITSTAPDPTNVSPIPMTATFSEPVTGFVLTDITVTNGAAANLTTTNNITFTFNVTPAAQGVVTVGILAGVATDAATNPNTAAPPLSRTFDSVAPTVTITSTAPNLTNVSPIPMTATFSEAVTGFEAADITVINGNVTAASFVGGPTVFTFNVTPAAQGVVTVNITATVATDAATNPNTAAVPLSRTFDSVAPTVTITSTAPNLTNVSPIPMTATFSEAVTGFEAADITVINGNVTAASFVGGPTVFTFNVTPAAQGVVTVNITAGVATDAATNPNTAAPALSRTFDTVAPTVTITTTAPEPTNVSPIPMTATFSEAVTGFILADITVTNGAAANLTTANNITFTFNVTPAAQGVVTVNITATVATDAATNPNTAAPPLSRTFDSVAPTVTITSTAPNLTNVSPIPMTATFSEAVTGFEATDITVINGNVTAGSFAGGPTVFTFNVTPAAQGVVTVNITATVATDAATNPNTAAPPLSRTFDSVAPTVTLTSTAPDPTNVSPIPMTATFSEAVTGFILADITVTNGAAANLTTANNITFTFNVTPAAQGVVTVNITATVATDAATNPNTAAPPLSRTFDSVAPTVTITSTAPNLTNVSPIPMTATFSEPVTGFVAGDITVTNGVVTTGSFTGTGAVYNWTVTPAAQGVVTVGIAAGMATDAAGNPNTAVPTFSITFVLLPPPPPPPPPPPIVVPGITDITGFITPEGVIIEAVTTESFDGLAQLIINEGTIGLVNGEPIAEISMTEMEDPPPPPAHSSVIGLAYDFGPDGATFNPPITLTITYDPALIPAGVAEENLVIAWWHAETGEWVNLDSVVDPVTNTITATVSHFTTFTVLAYIHPAVITTTDLLITPEEVDIGETVNISVLVTNTGNLTGNYTVTLKIDNVVVDTANVTLTGRASQRITFAVTRDAAGTYTVNVNGLSGTFIVKAPPEVEPPINWALIGGIIVAIVVAGLLIFFFFRRRRMAA